MPARKHETLLRQWHMLGSIPRFPSKTTAEDIRRALEREGFKVTRRTVERDLQELASVFPLALDDRDRPFGWSWDKNAKAFDLPTLTDSQALAFKLVEQYLRNLLPASVLQQLKPHFTMAAERLSESQKRNSASWLKKVHAIQPSQALLPPKINSAVQGVIYEALLHDRQIKARYTKRGEANPVEYLVHPLAVVQRGGITYLVCTLFDYKDVRMLVLHRFADAEALTEASRRPAGFSLDKYIADGAFGFGEGRPIKLKARFTNGAAAHLHETRLSEDQTLTAVEGEITELTATVVHTQQLVWWLRGFGEAVEVLAPAELRRDLATTAAAMHEIYKGGPVPKGSHKAG